MEITLSAVIEAARLRRAGVTAEVAGYVVLLAVQALARAPRRVSTDTLLLSEVGELRAVEAGALVSEVEVEADLRQLLATLTALAQSSAPALKMAAERAALGSLSTLEAELTAALIPINHAAARRALARLYREAHKSRVKSLSLAGETGTLSTPSPAPASVQRAPTPSPSPSSAVQRAPTPSAPAVSVAQRATSSEPSPRAPGVTSDERTAARVTSGTDLDIEVDLVGFEDAVSAAPRLDAGPLVAVERASAASLPAVALPAEPEPPDETSSCRSDLRELLAGFLSHTRSEDHMTAELRRMIGLEAPPLRRSSAPPPLLTVQTRAH